MMTNHRTEPITITSADINEERIAQLRQLFPEAFTEGKVDFAKLRATLGDLVDDRPERYSFSWAGKQDAIRILQTPTSATLIPAPAESVDFNNTQNIFIEGDNLEVLKLLYKSYFGRVKMVYIDPPYNTGNDFIYPDNYADPLDTYLQLTGQKDAEGNLQTTNSDTSGRYHSSWLTMIYPRLFIARQLLTESGSIWISADDTEVANLRILCNEIFGEENFVASFIWEKRTTRENRRVFSFNHDFILCYARDKDQFQADRNMLPLTDEVLQRYSNPDDDPRGAWQSVSMNAQAGHATPSQFYTIITPGGRELDPPPGRCWTVTKERFKDLVDDNRIWFGRDGNNVPRLKLFLEEANAGLTPHTLWKADEVGTNDSAKKMLNDLFDGNSIFDTPKPIELLQRIIQISTHSDKKHIVLDFFSGSCSTAQAILNQNRTDNGDRRFIMTQLPEPLPQNKSQFQSIAEIGKERIRRVIQQMKAEDEGKLPLQTRETPEDLGFKVFKLASTNFRSWDGTSKATPEEFASQMELFNDPLVEGWHPSNIIYEIALKEGYSLNCYIQRTAVSGHEVYSVNDQEKEQHFFLCLENKIATNIPAELKLAPPDLFVCRDIALNDTMAANLALQCRLKTI